MCNFLFNTSLHLNFSSFFFPFLFLFLNVISFMFLFFPACFFLKIELEQYNYFSFSKTKKMIIYSIVYLFYLDVNNNRLNEGNLFRMELVTMYVFIYSSVSLTSEIRLIFSVFNLTSFPFFACIC